MIKSTYKCSKCRPLESKHLRLSSDGWLNMCSGGWLKVKRALSIGLEIQFKSVRLEMIHLSHT